MTSAMKILINSEHGFRTGNQSTEPLFPLCCAQMTKMLTELRDHLSRIQELTKEFGESTSQKIIEGKREILYAHGGEDNHFPWETT